MPEPIIRVMNNALAWLAVLTVIGVAWYLVECASKETQTRALWAGATLLAAYTVSHL